MYVSLMTIPSFTQYREANQFIYVDGCVDVVLEVVKSKLYIFGGIFIVVAVVQVRSG